ncbi:hypothetical protein COOONC_15964 [Cooperia oncophora]
MYVVMDLPVSSVSTQHPWFRDGETDVFVTAKEGTPAFNQPNFHKFPQRERYQVSWLSNGIESCAELVQR